MAKARGKAKARTAPKRRPAPAQPPIAPVQPAPAPPPAAERLDPPDERASTRARVVTVAVVAACAAGTFLLLSGWTPGPGQPAPKKIVAAPAPVRKAPAPKPNPASKPAAPRAKPKPKPPTVQELAKEDFQGQCGFCHTLAAAGTTGTVGPDLDRLKPTRQRVLNAIAAGGRRTGLMPPGLLGGAEAARVAAFVAKASRR
jgi:mono/diheme cytochrome c family protein